MQRITQAEKLMFACITLLLFVLYTLLILVPPSTDLEANGRRTVTLNEWRGPFYGTTLITSVFAVALSVWFLHDKKRSGWFLLAFAASSPLFCGFGIGNDIMGFQSVGSVRDRDGTEYHFLQAHLLQGSELAICRFEGRVGLRQQFTVLATDPWEESFGYLAVVRPESASDRTKLFLTEDRVLVAIPYKNMAFLAYDLKKTEVRPTEGGQNPGNTNVRQLSPFLLLDADDSPRAVDIPTLYDSDSFGRSKVESVKPELDHRNPIVAGLARKLLADLLAHPPRPE